MTLPLSALVMPLDQSLQILSPDADQATRLPQSDVGQGAIPDPTLHRSETDVQNSSCLRGSVQFRHLIILIL
jgi:hypothetical protein